jgi:hypothetical protein
MQGENVYPISYRLGPVGRINSLLDSEMQIWAEPDLENAAFQIGASYQKYRGRGDEFDQTLAILLPHDPGKTISQRSWQAL